MKHRLKKGQESFEMVDGPYAGKKFEKGRLYSDIPKLEAWRFEPVKAAPAKTGGPAKTDAEVKTGTAAKTGEPAETDPEDNKSKKE